ncbi:phage minor head protein [Nonomuraea sp. NPDC049646]|uniref:phage minor head protein n=1 Tax=unclassified Nonomuraea TaxID=2593643 RepID=UPI00378B5429
MAERDPRQVQRDSADRALSTLEDGLQRVVQQALDRVARDFAQAVTAATRTAAAAEGRPALTALTAAVDDALLRQLAALWTTSLPDLLAALLRIYAAAAAAVWRRFTSGPPPPYLKNLPGQWREDPASVPDRVQDYLQQATNRLTGVGDRLWEAARAELAEGTLAGEGVDQLARRLQRVFADDGAQLGQARARRIARTETAAAWNRAALDQALALPETARPSYKSWLATADTRTRPEHWEADGQTVPLTAPFTVDGEQLQFPCDPTGSPANVVQCRCTLTFGDEPEPPADDGRQYLDDAQIAEVIAYFEEQGIVRDAHPQQSLSAASSGPHSGAMIALVPSQADIERLALPDGEPAEELHLTLLFLGKADDIDPDMRTQIIDTVTAQAGALRGEDGVPLPVEGNAFAVSVFNPSDDPDAETCIVLGVGGADLQTAQRMITYGVTDVFDLPEQHLPWVPHVTLTYTRDVAQLAQLVDRVGPITFDRLRVAFGGEVTDIPLTAPIIAPTAGDDMPAPDDLPPRRWSTPGNLAIAFENVQTGDGRVFAPGALYWEAGPWPLQYADEMLGGHDGAELAGAIETLSRDGDRIPAAGVLYPSQSAGANAIRLLEEDAPLGVSVDLDDVDIEFLDARPADQRTAGEEADVVLMASLTAASVLRLADGRWMVRASHVVDWTASSHPHGQDEAGQETGGQVRAIHTVEWTTTTRGTVAATGLRALAAAGAITAAAGDPIPDDGEVLFSEASGDYLMRITRARLRGATLVAMPAFAGARILLDPVDATAAGDCPEPLAGRMREVIAYVAGSPIPVGAGDVAVALSMTSGTARDHLLRAANAGHIRSLTRGLYVAASTLPETAPELAAAMSGDLQLPLHEDRDTAWDGGQAASRVLAWATDDQDRVDADRLGRAFLWRDPDADPATLAAYKLGIADVFTSDGTERLEIVAAGVFAAAGALQGARGGVDIPATEQEELRGRLDDLYERMAEFYEDPALAPPWEGGEGMDDLEASAWQEFQNLPPLPAAWFAEPTVKELPPDSGGVHIRDGRIYGWVAQRGVPHEAFPGRKLTVESLGDIDFSTFLRSKFQLDDGSVIRVGAMTMNAGHHRDGAECETASCQFDDTRTVAGIVTVGMSAGGMWFSGAAAPWLSDWDRMVFGACQPSYHMRQLPSGRWSLRAVLSVPVPGHPSRLAASAVIDRANLALIAAAPARPGEEARPGGELAMLAAAVVDEMERRASVRAEIARLADQVAPARAEVAASLAARVTGGQ